MAAHFIHAEQPARIGVVVAEQQGRCGIEIKPEFTQIRVRDLDGAWPADQRRLRYARAPRPNISAAQLRQQGQHRGIRPSIVRGDLHENIVGRSFCVFDKHVEVAIVIEQTRIQELELCGFGAAPAVFLKEPRVGKSGLRILVEHLQV